MNDTRAQDTHEGDLKSQELGLLPVRGDTQWRL